ncbi:MAG: phytanoyl-CoA dioxygenase family protein, partial [Caldilineaceae bacterium]|nr:phytanoyl-CoA dioxygenase family protein [Caldilineaceae bacterium]
MSAKRTVVRPIELTDNEVYFYQTQGYLLIPNLIEPAMLDELREAVLDVLEANGVSRAQLDHASSTADKLRQNPQYLQDSLLDELINGEAMMALASRLIGGRAVRYLPFTAVKAGGGGGQFHFHQDNNYTQHDPALGSINIWVALVDMTPENG